MTVSPDHWLVDPAVVRIPLPGGSPMNIRRCLVIHFTAGTTGRSSIDWWRNPKAKGASAHIVIERDGEVIQCRPFNRTAGHAGPRGKSRWVCPKTGVRIDGLNSCSIGIELANAGRSDDALAWAKVRGFKTMRARHANGGPVSEWETFPEAQIVACIEVARVLVARYNLDDITGHDCISPERKDDPGPAFPMARLREACGFKSIPVVHRKPD